MKLIGMLDSPYVRRVAVSMHLLDLPFEHLSISVHRQIPAFAAFNPVIKAPSFVTDDGTVLMDSTLILEHLEKLAGGRSLMPAKLADHTRALRILGLALAACEKSVQIVYETALRPPERQHEPWLTRIHDQLHQAYRLLETEIAAADPWLFGDQPGQADITAAIAWRFTNSFLPGRMDATAHPALVTLSERAEALPAFQACPPPEGGLPQRNA